VDMLGGGGFLFIIGLMDTAFVCNLITVCIRGGDGLSS
jgi:hypothetical protein